MTRAVRFLRLTALAAALAACDRAADGVREYESGRFREAMEAFAAAQGTSSDDAPVELSYDEALAALRAGDTSRAESAAARAAAHGGPAFAELRDFVRGNAAFARSRLSEAQARGPEAEPFAWDVAIAQAESARSAWQAAAMSRADWPQARRNVERALLAVERLKALKAKAGEQKARSTASAPNLKKGAPKDPQRGPEIPPPPRPVPPPPPTTGRPDGKPPERADAQQGDLPPGQVMELLQVLAAKEREKLDQRRALQGAPRPGPEKDW